MSRRKELLERAARCFEQAELFSEAGECFRNAGLLKSAGAAFYRADDLPRAAESYRAANEMGLAADLYEQLGRPVEAAVCWESVGDTMRSGWVLATRTGRVRTAAGLLRRSTTTTPGGELRKELGLALCEARTRHESDPLEKVLARCETELPRLAVTERRLVERWATTAATIVGRPDLAGLIFAASYRARTPGAGERWLQWAGDALGGTFGIPTSTASSA